MAKASATQVATFIDMIAPLAIEQAKTFFFYGGVVTSHLKRSVNRRGELCSPVP